MFSDSTQKKGHWQNNEQAHGCAIGIVFECIHWFVLVVVIHFIRNVCIFLECEIVRKRVLYLFVQESLILEFWNAKFATCGFVKSLIGNVRWVKTFV